MSLRGYDALAGATDNCPRTTRCLIPRTGTWIDVESYLDDEGEERCDYCDELIDECECQCSECGDRVTECSCEEGPTYPATADR